MRQFWLITVWSSLAWSVFVFVHYLGNGFRSGICGAGLLETAQFLFVLLVWLPANLYTFGSFTRKRGDWIAELSTIITGILSFWAQYQWEPACAAYM